MSKTTLDNYWFILYLYSSTWSSFLILYPSLPPPFIPLSPTLPQVVQLTGFSDPVYAETYVNVNQYDIVLDVLIVNQTGDTLQGLTLELATLGTGMFLIAWNLTGQVKN